MRIAIFENIMTPGGNEIEFDRILVEELKNLGHEVFFYAPENLEFQFDYKVPVVKIRGDAVSYTNSSGIKKIFASAKREINRQRWYSQLHYLQKQFDALIIPTATYRYLRALIHNDLKKISVPLIFVFHGINPGEAPKFLAVSKKLLPYKNVKQAVITLSEDIFGQTLDNIFTILPPTFIPRDINLVERWKDGKVESNNSSFPTPHSSLKIGFFGQYRREKKIEDLLKVFAEGNYNREVNLIVQGTTMHEEDAAEFEKIIAPYEKLENISVIRKPLIGVEWQKAILNVDALLIPYSAPRYKYHWGGMLFTALGYEKPVISSSEMNPEIFSQYKIGETFESGNLEDLDRVLKDFINNFDENISEYKKNLQAANENFSPANFGKRLEKIITT